MEIFRKFPEKITVLFQEIPRKYSENLWYKNVMNYSKKCPQYHLIGYVRLKNSSITEKSYYGQWTWSLDKTWMDDELMMDWLMDGCFPLFYLLTYFINGTFPEKVPEIFKFSGKFPAFYFSGKVTTLVPSVFKVKMFFYILVHKHWSLLITLIWVIHMQYCLMPMNELLTEI